ncbi:MAG: DNA-directed RNA polymerase subunit omega [Candidatus Omnitrophota bacterium]
MADKEYIYTEELLDKVGSVYDLVILASKRGLELNEGSPRLIDTPSKKILTIALEEIRAGKISVKEKKKPDDR